MTATDDRSIAERTAHRMRWLCLFVLAGIGMHAGAAVAAPGDLDPGFGAFGRVQLPFDGGIDPYLAVGRPAIVRQPDGRVLVARTDRTGSEPTDSEVAVARLRPDGTLDPEFDTGGVVRLRFRAGEAAGVGGLALLPDGRIVVVGYSIHAWLETGMGYYPYLDTGLALVRTDGSLDPDGFGNGGRLALDLAGSGLTDHAISAVGVHEGGCRAHETTQSALIARFVRAINEARETWNGEGEWIAAEKAKTLARAARTTLTPTLSR